MASTVGQGKHTILVVVGVEVLWTREIPLEDVLESTAEPMDPYSPYEKCCFPSNFITHSTHPPGFGTFTRR
jgi:hypothetical protein